MNDAQHTYKKAVKDADEDDENALAEDKREMMTAIPFFVRGRVEREGEWGALPRMEVGKSREEDILAAVVKHIVGEEGEMAKELFVDLMEYLEFEWYESKHA